MAQELDIFFVFSVPSHLLDEPCERGGDGGEGDEVLHGMVLMAEYMDSFEEKSLANELGRDAGERGRGCQ